MNQKGFNELKKLLSSKLDSIVEIELEKLEKIAKKENGYIVIEHMLGEDGNSFCLLEAVGIVKKFKEEPTLYQKKSFYSLTEEGKGYMD